MQRRADFKHLPPCSVVTTPRLTPPDGAFRERFAGDSYLCHDYGDGIRGLVLRLACGSEQPPVKDRHVQASSGRNGYTRPRLSTGFVFDRFLGRNLSHLNLPSSITSVHGKASRTHAWNGRRASLEESART